MTKGQFEIIKLILDRTSNEHKEYLKNHDDLPELINESINAEIKACDDMVKFINQISN